MNCETCQHRFICFTTYYPACYLSVLNMPITSKSEALLFCQLMVNKAHYTPLTKIGELAELMISKLLSIEDDYLYFGSVHVLAVEPGTQQILRDNCERTFPRLKKCRSMSGYMKNCSKIGNILARRDIWEL